MSNNADGEEFLAVVASLHHQAKTEFLGQTFQLSRRGWFAPVDETLDDGHLCLLELLLGVTACGVGNVDSMSDLNIVSEGDVLDLDAGAKPWWLGLLLSKDISRSCKILTLEYPTFRRA